MNAVISGTSCYSPSQYLMYTYNILHGMWFEIHEGKKLVACHYSKQKILTKKKKKNKIFEVPVVDEIIFSMS